MTFITQFNWSRLTAALLAAVFLVSLNFGAATPVSADDTTTWTLKRFQPLSEVLQDNQVRKGGGVKFLVFVVETGRTFAEINTKAFTKGTFNGEEGRWFEVQVTGIEKNREYGIRIQDFALQHKNKKKRNGTFKCCKQKLVYPSAAITDGSGEILSTTATGASYGPNNWFDAPNPNASLVVVERRGKVEIYRAF